MSFAEQIQQALNISDQIQQVSNLSNETQLRLEMFLFFSHIILLPLVIIGCRGLIRVIFTLKAIAGCINTGMEMLESLLDQEFEFAYPSRDSKQVGTVFILIIRVHATL